MKVSELKHFDRMKRIYDADDALFKAFCAIQDLLLKRGNREILSMIDGFIDLDPSREVDLPEDLERNFQPCIEWMETRKNPDRVKKVFQPGRVLFVVIAKETGEIVLAADKCERHFQVANNYWEIIGRGEEKMEVCGGGSISIDPDKKEIFFYGQSGDFGSFCGLLVESLARRAMKEEGYDDYKLKVAGKYRLPIWSD